MRLTDDYRAKRQEWAAAGIDLPARRADPAAPVRWLHFGAGSLFRAVQVPIAQALIDQGELAGGVCVAETFDPEIVDRAYRPFRNRSLNVVLRSDGSVQTSLLDAVPQALAFRGVGSAVGDWDRLAALFADPALQLVTVTITEKGYKLFDAQGQALPWVAPELAGGPAAANSAMGVMTALLLNRFTTSAAPLALVSTDNFSQNGDRFRQSVVAMAQAWADRGLVAAGFVEYVSDEARVSFPLTMIDRITPNPAQSVADRLAASGFEDGQLIHTERGTNVAAFANTEETWYLVVEDKFPGGRPALEKAGVLLGDRDTVNAADEMKVTGCLNPLHTALAVFGMLLGYPSMWQTIADPDLSRLVRVLGYQESLPVVPDPGILSPQAFLDAVVQVRVPNPSLPDTPARISTDTSQKVPIRYGVTIGKYLADPALDVASLTAIPLVLAGWLRLLLGADGQGTGDAGQVLSLSPDPRLADLQAALAPLSVGGDLSPADAIIRQILTDTTIFANDLSQTVLAEKVIRYFKGFASGLQTVHTVLQAALAEPPAAQTC